MSRSSVAELANLGVPGLQLRSFQRLAVSGLELRLFDFVGNSVSEIAPILTSPKKF